jgi:S1-C subfamily serine protease
MEVVASLRWWAALLPAVAAFAADPPIDRMEASTVRVIVQDSKGAGETGSGFIVGDGSFVVTNHHVVEDAQAVLVMGKDLKIPVLRLAADDPGKDLAVLQLKQNSGRPPVMLGLRSGVKKTETVLAAGFPGAADDQGGIDDFLEVKFSKGIVSAFVRSQSGTMLYQIDAPINPGNSGGPLFDECGNVVGIDAMKSLRPAVVVGADGQPTQERLPYGEGVAWAIQSDELLSVLRTAGITAKVAARACGAAGDTRQSEPTTADTGTADPGARRDSRPAGQSLILIGAGAAILLALAVAFVAVAKSRPSAAPAQAPYRPQMGGPPMPDLRLRGVSGSHAGMEFPVSAEPITLGRDPHMSQIVFDPQDSVVSKRHCIVRMDRVSGGLFVEDCGSRNGTFLDSGERLRSGEPRLVPRYGSFYLGDRSHVFQVKV